MENPVGRLVARRSYLLVALAAALLPTLGLAVMQYHSARRLEAHARATMEANLDLHLVALVDEARNDIIEYASNITHAIRHASVRGRNRAGLARTFHSALRRYPSIGTLYAVFFDRGAETEPWRTVRYVPEPPPGAGDARRDPPGEVVDDPDAAQALRRAFLAIPDRAADRTYAAFAPASVADPTPRQLFFHPIYSPNHMSRRGAMDRVGLLVFTADAQRFPYPGYWQDLVARRGRWASSWGSREPLLYHVALAVEGGLRPLVASSGRPALRSRRFEPGYRLFPDVHFSVAMPGVSGVEGAAAGTRLSLLLGVGAAGLSLAGAWLAWRASARERRLAQLQSDFLASVSHELKTPITAIRAFGDLLRSGRTRDARRAREYGEMISYESERLAALVGNILEMARIERGVRRYRIEERDVGEAVRSTVEVFRAALAGQGFELALVLPPTPLLARFDEGALHQAVMNLLANAAKYSGDARRIEVEVAAGITQATVRVRDFGLGIAASEQRRIFRAFHRAPHPDVQAKPGTGLGLAIVQEIVRAHGGAVTVDSEPGQGSTFTIVLPQVVQAGAAPAVVAPVRGA